VPPLQISHRLLLALATAVWQLSNNKFPENAEFHSPTEKHLVDKLPTFDFCFSYTHVYTFVRQET